MKKVLLTFATILLVTFRIFAQTGVAINATGAEPDNSAMLDVSSITKGVLVTRMTEEQRTNIISPATGLLFYQTNGNSGFYYFDGIVWTSLPGGYYTETDPVVKAVNGIVKSNGTTISAALAGTDYLEPGQAVTGVTGTSPVVSSGGINPVISISAATTSAAGSMSAADKSKLNAQTTGTAAGQMQYWNGTAWVTVASGQNGQILKYKNGLPTWVDDNIENLSIGDHYQGGIIAYFLQPGDPGYDANVRHGIIAAPGDQSIAKQWYNGSFTTTGATGTAIGTGNANTSTIVASQGAGSYAAQVCADLVLGGYSDWYLPAKDELNKLYLNKDAIGGFSADDYWSSSESLAYFAWGQSFNNGGQYAWAKSDKIRVRAIRSF